MNIFLQMLEQEGWTAGHAPEGLIAEKIKYKIGDDPEWQPFYKAIPQEPHETIVRPCIMTFTHEAHTFPLSILINGTNVVQRCPGVYPHILPSSKTGDY